MEAQNRSIVPSFNEWPSFSDGGKYLCVIRNHAGVKQHGFIILGSSVVNLGYIWDGGTGEYLEYESLNAIFADGWQVD